MQVPEAAIPAPEPLCLIEHEDRTTKTRRVGLYTKQRTNKGVTRIFFGRPSVMAPGSDIENRLMQPGLPRPAARYVIRPLFNTNVGSLVTTPAYSKILAYKQGNVPPAPPSGSAIYHSMDKDRRTAIMRVYEMRADAPYDGANKRRTAVIALIGTSRAIQSASKDRFKSAVEEAFHGRFDKSNVQVTVRVLAPGSGKWSDESHGVAYRLSMPPTVGCLALTAIVTVKNDPDLPAFKMSATHASWLILGQNLIDACLPRRIAFTEGNESWVCFLATRIRDVGLSKAGTGFHGDTSRVGDLGGVVDGVPIPMNGGTPRSNLLASVDMNPSTKPSHRLSTDSLQLCASVYSATEHLYPSTGLSMPPSMRAIAASTYNNLFCQGNATRFQETQRTLLRSVVPVDALTGTEQAKEKQAETLRRQSYSQFYPTMADALALRSWMPLAPQRLDAPTPPLLPWKPLTSGRRQPHIGAAISSYLMRAYLNQFVLRHSRDPAHKNLRFKCCLAMDVAQRAGWLIAPSNAPDTMDANTKFMDPELRTLLSTRMDETPSPVPDPASLPPASFVPKLLVAPMAPTVSDSTPELSHPRQGIRMVVSPSGRQVAAPATRDSIITRWKEIN